LATSAPAVPALIDYDYVGLRPAVEELKACLTYCRAALATSSR